MKSGWKREEASIAAVCGGCQTGTQQGVAQSSSGSSSGKTGEQWEEEEEEEGGEHYHGGGSSYGRVECCIIKALIRITRRSTRSGLCVRPGVTGGLGGHIVLSNVVYFYSLRFECITFDLWWYGTISRVRIHIYFISICASNFNMWTSHEPCSSFWKQKESYILN